MSTADRPRTAAEWTTLAVSSFVLLVVVAVIGVELFEQQDPAAPVAQVVGPVRELHGRHVVDVEVTNEGDETAANVQITASLEVDGEVTEADQVIDFLAGGADEELVFAFDDDPADGELTVAVSSFSEP